MCFAPRYISGPTAAPRSDWRKTASLPDTPCAPTSEASTSASVRRPVDLRATLVALMACVARDIQGLSCFEHLVGAPRLCRSQDDASAVDHHLRHFDPLPVVDAAAFHQQQVARLDERCRI